MLFGDFGVNTLSQGLIAHKDTIAHRPEMIRKFLRATARAIKEIAKPQNFDEATEISMRETKRRRSVVNRSSCNGSKP